MKVETINLWAQLIASIGVIVSSLDSYFHRAVFGIEDCAYANDYNVLISQTRDE